MRGCCLLILVVAFLIASVAARNGPNPSCVSDVSSLVPQGGASYANGTVTFLSDHTLAVGMCFRAVCNLQTFDISGGSPRQVGRVNGIDRYHAVFRSGDGGVLLAGISRRGERGAILLDEGLHTSRWIPKAPGSSAFGEKIAQGQGKLLSHTRNLSAYWDHGAIQIQSAAGQIVGSFEVSGTHIPAISFLGPDRILFGQTEIRDFDGKVLRKLKKPDRALGEKTTQSEDGSRLLFDSFTRRVGLAQTIKEDALVVPTLGMSADGYVPNGEVVRAIDTGSGKQCFEWYGTENLLAPFEDHADIDPSGRLVAILTRNTLAIFVYVVGHVSGRCRRHVQLHKRRMKRWPRFLS